MLSIAGDSPLYQLPACQHNFVAIPSLSRITSLAMSVIQVISRVLAELGVYVCVGVCLLGFDNIRLLGVNLWWCTAHSLCVRLQSSD